MTLDTLKESGMEGEEKRVAIQGVEGSFHEIATRKFLGEDCQIVPCDSFNILFRALDEGEANLGVMAIENSVAGSIIPNYALLRESSFTVIGEVYLRIEHNFMAQAGQTIQDIQEVHSHPMAIRQCHDFLNKYRHIKVVETADTAGSAKWIRDREAMGVAAIGSSLAASHYGLEIYGAGIETNKRNFTRFLILMDKDKAASVERKPEKASLCFNLAGLSMQVGGLSRVLLVLSAHMMNLTKIQSLPILGKEWQYFFHIDLEFDDFEQYKRALAAIQPIVSELRILGEYAKGEKYMGSNLQEVISEVNTGL
ncbi:MAG: prephenate dehydratase [Bacteroidota bacterium]